MREKKLMWSIITSFLFLIVSMISGFVVPKLILIYYGSEINGLMDSVTQFLKIIVFLEFGVGAVVQSSLYKPLVEKDNEKISQILLVSKFFFRKIAIIFLIYIIFLMFIYPLLNGKNFEYFYIDTLIFVMSLNLFFQYYFGITDKILLLADQKAYIIYIIQTLVVLLNAFFCVILIINGASIHIIQLVTSLIYIARNIFFRLYVKKHYLLNFEIKYNNNCIEQKWNGFAQHISLVILESTDTIILTIFSTLTNVSIYSIYYLIINGVRQLIRSMTNGIQSLLGEIIAKKDNNELIKIFEFTEWSIHNLSTLIWGCTIVLIMPFIKIYTNGIDDANYYIPIFGYLISLAFFFESIRLSYYILILAAGHYKQTQFGFLFTTIVNIIISVFNVKIYGIVGVVIGTLIALIFHTLWMANYSYKNILERSLKNFIKKIFLDLFLLSLIFVSTVNIKMSSLSYISWIILSLKVLIIGVMEILFVNYIFDYDKISNIYFKILKKIKNN